ncbi:hypothetical protein LTR84_008642 [Exophiala bonariae]|uniref:Cytochrome P450 monooxygenase n=1 Tax=Exophiala bonariae TaxID=1690606 RepID=A0AAV9MXA4_9EURO|nr:hypothetical protein LTR84_008642 [Exophiala bonariae]
MPVIQDFRLRANSWIGTYGALLLAIGNLVLLQLCICVYRIWFHPLSKYPGPAILKVVSFPWIYTTLIKGTGPRSILELHRKCGKIVRLGPNHLAVDGSIGFPQVFGNRKVDHPKLPGFFIDFPNAIIGSNREVHRRQRRQLNPAFSDLAVKEQESIVTRYVDLLLDKLSEQEALQKHVNIVEWLNFTTFDVIGDLTFGESFHSLEQSGYHPWVLNIVNSVRIASIARFLLWYIPPAVLSIGLKGTGIMKLAHEARFYAKEKALARISLGPVPKDGRRDFMTYMLNKEQNGGGMSETEIVANSPFLVGAGSETIATALSSLFFHLASNPSIYKAVADELRSKFHSKEDITVQSTTSLQHLNACIEETLRIYPPVCESPPRISLADGVVDGNYIPKGTIITVSQYATFRNPEHFQEPGSFLPQRWFPPSHPLFEDRFQSDNKAAFKPFSFGARDCIGKRLAYAEMRVLAARFLHVFDFDMLPNQEDWLNKQLAFVIWDKGPLYIALQRRSTS